MSKSLYIIGNGFDRAHGLKTSYWDFRTYLEENHWEFLLAFEKLYDFEPFDEADPYTAKMRRNCTKIGCSKNYGVNLKKTLVIQILCRWKIFQIAL